VRAVARRAKKSLGNVAKADQTENQASKSRPQQQLAAWSLPPDILALRH
jgi:hypothetical protein